MAKLGFLPTQLTKSPLYSNRRFNAPAFYLLFRVRTAGIRSIISCVIENWFTRKSNYYLCGRFRGVLSSEGNKVFQCGKFARNYRLVNLIYSMKCFYDILEFFTEPELKMLASMWLELSRARDRMRSVIPENGEQVMNQARWKVFRPGKNLHLLNVKILNRAGDECFEMQENKIGKGETVEKLLHVIERTKSWKNLFWWMAELHFLLRNYFSASTCETTRISIEFNGRNRTFNWFEIKGFQMRIWFPRQCLTSIVNKKLSGSSWNLSGFITT